MYLIQVTPYLAPSSSGVGDYALILARLLRDNHGVVTKFVVANRDEALPSVVEGFQVSKLSRGVQGIEQCVSGADVVLLHYVGYGYQKRGCPQWLLRALNELRSSGKSTRTITMFHELYAFGKLWQSSFWTNPLQRMICREIARASQVAVTNRVASQKILLKMRNGKGVHRLPVFSNVGEPLEHSPFEARKRRLVLFGSASWRRKALDEYAGILASLCERYELTEGIEIGPGETPMSPAGIPWKKLGLLPADEVSNWLSSSLLGFIAYPSSYLEKSGIFAAYVAHGVVPVIPEDLLRSGTMGVDPGKHLMADPENGDILSDGMLSEMSCAGFEWYQMHRSDAQAEEFFRMILD